MLTLPEDYLAAELGKTWRDSKYADVPCPRLTPCRCGVLQASTNSTLCSVCQTPAVMYVTGTGAGTVDHGGRRSDTPALIAVTVLFLLAAAMIANSMMDAGPRPGDAAQVMEAS